MTYDDANLTSEDSALDIAMELRPRRGISRHLSVEDALPICEQCNSSGSSGPVQISSSGAESIGFSVSMIWAHKPFGETDCRWVYLCEECSWKIQVEAATGEEDWFASKDVYGIHANCPQCQNRE